MPDSRTDFALLRPEEIDVAPLRGGMVDWVEMETPSDRPDLIGRLLDRVEAGFAGLGVDITRHAPREGCGGHMTIRYAPPGTEGKAPVAMIGHVDTVWAAGTLDRRPVRRDGDRLYGPGIYDMKAGSYLVTETVRRLASAGETPPRPLVVLLNSDEEIGSPTSQALIETLAAEAAFVLVPEPGIGPEAAVVTARKGWGRFDITASGRSSHAGGNLHDGRSAIREICRQVLDIEAMTGSEPGATFNVGTIHGGTRRNVVPAEAEIAVDMRFADTPSGKRLVERVLGLQSYDPDVRLKIEGGMNRPAFERNAAVTRLYEATRRLAERIGVNLPETSRGGVSDGNFAAALGKPVLDGLGCGGAGAHAEDEHILISTIAPRAALLRNILMSAAFQIEVVR